MSSPTTLATVALAVLALCFCKTVSAITSPGGGAGLTLRVRMPDGAVRRVQASPGDTVNGLISKLDIGEGGDSGRVGLSTDAAGEAVEPTASVRALGLGNGDFLYVKVWRTS